MCIWKNTVINIVLDHSCSTNNILYQQFSTLWNSVPCRIYFRRNKWLTKITVLFFFPNLNTVRQRGEADTFGWLRNVKGNSVLKKIVGDCEAIYLGNSGNRSASCILFSFTYVKKRGCPGYLHFKWNLPRNESWKNKMSSHHIRKSKIIIVTLAVDFFWRNKKTNSLEVGTGQPPAADSSSWINIFLNPY